MFTYQYIVKGPLPEDFIKSLLKTVDEMRKDNYNYALNDFISLIIGNPCCPIEIATDYLNKLMHENIVVKYIYYNGSILTQFLRRPDIDEPTLLDWCTHHGIHNQEECFDGLDLHSILIAKRNKPLSLKTWFTLGKTYVDDLLTKGLITPTLNGPDGTPGYELNERYSYLEETFKPIICNMDIPIEMYHDGMPFAIFRQLPYGKKVENNIKAFRNLPKNYSFKS